MNAYQVWGWILAGILFVGLWVGMAKLCAMAGGIAFWQAARFVFLIMAGIFAFAGLLFLMEWLIQGGACS